ncbi:MAG: hypothetical protein AB2A00_26690 [Myxococcota bacterium]
MGRQKLIFIYNGESGVAAMLLDALKKVVGREDCALCEIVYSPVGKRPSWRACQARLGVEVEERHRDSLPSSWGIRAEQLPCILLAAPTSDGLPTMLVDKNELEGCRGLVPSLEVLLRAKLPVDHVGHASPAPS